MIERSHVIDRSRERRSPLDDRKTDQNQKRKKPDLDPAIGGHGHEIGNQSHVNGHRDHVTVKGELEADPETKDAEQPITFY